MDAQPIRKQSSSKVLCRELKYVPRLKQPEKSDYRYYSNRNIFYAAGYGMPNCTAYAWGRMYELTGTRYTQICGNAGKWIGQAVSSGLKTGSVPKLGAIAVWKSANAGHVAVVEEICENGDILTSNSQWHGKEFFMKKITKESAYKYAAGFELLGFIYTGDNNDSCGRDAVTGCSENCDRCKS